MTKFVALRAKTYSFLIDDFTNDDYEKNRIVNKEVKGTKKCVVKRETLFNNYIDSLFKNKVLYRSQQRFRSDHHKVYTEEVNKITLSSNDDKRIQTFDKVTTYPYGTNVFIACRNEMLLKNEFINSKSLSLIEKSQVLRKESQTHRNNSLLLRNELKEIRAESNNIKNKSYILRAESQILRNKSNEPLSLIDKSKVLRQESQALRNNSLLLRNELKEIRAESNNIKNKSYILRIQSQMLRNKSAKNEIEKESSQIIDRSQKPKITDNDNKPYDNTKLEIINNVIDENKDIDNNILSTKILLQNRKIFNYMEMILKKFIWEQFICGKFCNIKSSKNKFIIEPRNRSLKNIKIIMRKEEIFIRIEKNLKKLERSVEINIDSNQIMLVLSNIRKNISRYSYISIFENKISSYTLFNKRNLNLYTNDEMGYIGMRREIKSEVLYCIKQKIKKAKALIR